MVGQWRVRTSLWACLIVLTSQKVSFASSPPNPDLPDLVERVMAGVVNVSSITLVGRSAMGWEDFLRSWGLPQERKQSSLGSGFIIDKEGYILTNNHVVADADEVVVALADKTTLRAKIIGKDQKMDLALLQIRDSKAPVLKPVPLGDSDTVRIGETVFAVGNPFGLQHTVTSGILSAKHRTIGLGPFDNFLQTDASVNPGNSGGPLFGSKGEVIGITTAIRSPTQSNIGINFAIPVNEAKRIIADLKRYGRVPRPWLGLLADRVTPQMVRYYDLPVAQGVIVLNIVEGGPAQRAGLRQADILTQINDNPVTDPYEVERILSKLKPSDPIRVTLRRGTRAIELKLKLAELPRLREIPEGIL